MQHFTIHIFGHVQGVFFRVHAKELAEKLGITGYIRNEPDGSVHVVAEGKEPQLDTFVEWCRKGPPAAKVSRIQTHKGEAEGYLDFEIRHQ
jgi:acylphosphatase